MIVLSLLIQQLALIVLFSGPFLALSQEVPDEVTAVPSVQNSPITEPEDELELDFENDEDDDQSIITARIVGQVFVHGLSKVMPEVVLSKISYYGGEPYKPHKASSIIKALLGTDLFKNVQIYGQPVGKDLINIHVVVDEKLLLKEMKFEGNHNLTLKEIETKGFDPQDVQTIDEIDIQKYIAILKKLYREKDFHNTDITAELIDEDEKVTVIFHINENKKSIVKCVFFEGNKAISDQVLRSKIFTREDWLLSFMDRAGSFQPDAIESDRHMLEDFYQSNGYLMAKVTDVKIEHQEGTNGVHVTFFIEEGDQYTISAVSAPGNDEASEEQLLRRIPIKPGDLYSRERIRDAIESLRLFWGKKGYIDADIEPSIEPDEDTKTVKLTFYSELGNKVYINRITIRGNEKTSDKVIRRQMGFDEGDLLTFAGMEETKDRIESLGFFEERDGVIWKVKRKDKETADVDLIVNEVKTGRLDLQIGWGGSGRDISSPLESVKIGGSVSDTNLFGRGIAFNLNGEYGKQQQQIFFNITNPWLFDKPIYGALDGEFRRSLYQDFRFTVKEVKENMGNIAGSIGFKAKMFYYTQMVTTGGFESITFNEKPEVNPRQIVDPKERVEFQRILDRRFPNGNFPYFGFRAGQDFRNHPLHPSRGYQWLLSTKLGVPHDDYGFWRFDFDGSYYTPLIGERDLVFHFHGHIGLVAGIQENIIPYRELFNIGGPASVRGFLFGDIGPKFKGVDPLGSKRAFWLNAELIFPIAPDFSIKGVVFYDGGAGWDTPDSNLMAPKRVIDNMFDYRHAVGFGFRLLRPTPMKIDWGFKLDKREGERESEVHFSMSQAF